MRGKAARGAVCLLAFLVLGGAAFAQGAHHPFAVGANEGAVGPVSGVTAWLLAQQSAFYRLLADAVREVRTNPAAAWTLAGLSFAYGVFHAAGPGHGKAVVAAYLLSSEKALRRGLAIAGLAALLQSLVAIGIVGIAALVFHATAPRMTQAAQLLELASYGGIVALGVWLVWTKGRRLVALLRPGMSMPRLWSLSPAPQHSAAPLPRFAGEKMATALILTREAGAGDRQALRSSTRFRADDGATHIHDANCGHLHMPDPGDLGANFAWKGALVTVLTVGARPCSGAILVLVFALAQGIFAAGIGAALAMSCGVAVTTGLLASLAVFAKRFALKLTGTTSRRAVLAVRLLETGAAVCVLLFGIALLAAYGLGTGMTT